MRDHPAHFRGKRLPSPQPAGDIAGWQLFPGTVLREELDPLPVQIRMTDSDRFKLALEHGRAHPAANPFKTHVVERIGRQSPPPDVKKDLDGPPVPDRRYIELPAMERVLADGWKTGTGE